MQLSEEIKMLRKVTRDFVVKELYPLENEVEQLDEVPDDMRKELVKKTKKLGLWNATTSKEWDGGGFTSVLDSVVLSEEHGKASPALGMFAGLFGGFSPPKNASKHQLERFYLPSLRGEKRSCLALTEPDAGSWNMGMKTTAVRQGDNYVINGTKHFITGARKADYAMVVCWTDKSRGSRGLSQILVEKGTPGFKVVRNQPMMGIRGSEQCELSFQDCAVPVANRIGEEGEGIYQALGGLSKGRLNMGGLFTGTAVRLLDMSIDYSQRRVTWGRPIAERQAIQWMLADIAVEIFASRSMTRETAWRVDNGEDTRVRDSMVKLFTSNMVNRAADKALQIHGGLGYSKDLPIERIYRDVRLWRIGEGTDEIQRYIISRAVLARVINMAD